MKNLAFKITATFILLCVNSVSVLAQVPDYPESPDAGEDPLPQASIDSCILILLVAALILGLCFKMKPIFKSDSDSAQN